MNKYQTCHGCPDRVVGCHATCEGYQARYAENREKNEANLRGYVEPPGTTYSMRIQNGRAHRQKIRRNP